VKGKKMRGMKVEEMKVSRKYDDFLVVWYKWKWKESEGKECGVFNKITQISIFILIHITKIFFKIGGSKTGRGTCLNESILHFLSYSNRWIDLEKRDFHPCSIFPSIISGIKQSTLWKLHPPSGTHLILKNKTR
jgi:hypothetical protein